MKVDNFITDLYKIYHTKVSLAYSELENIEEVELVSFTYGIFLILGALKLDPKEIKVGDRTLKDNLDDIIRGYLKEPLNGNIHDKNNVDFREHILSGK
jgi:hypothetical protein